MYLALSPGKYAETAGHVMGLYGHKAGSASQATAQVGLDGNLMEPSQQERRAQALHKYKQKRKVSKYPCVSSCQLLDYVRDSGKCSTKNSTGSRGDFSYMNGIVSGKLNILQLENFYVVL